MTFDNEKTINELNCTNGEIVKQLLNELMEIRGEIAEVKAKINKQIIDNSQEMNKEEMLKITNEFIEELKNKDQENIGMIVSCCNSFVSKNKDNPKCSLLDVFTKTYDYFNNSFGYAMSHFIQAELICKILEKYISRFINQM